MEQYLTFSLGAEQYGVDILRVQEIRGYAAATPVPNTPRYVRGVMNLRGAIVPVLDLRDKLLGVAGTFTPVTAVVVVTVAGGKTHGLVVDSVTDVVEFDPSTIQPVPDFGAHVDTRCVRGLAPGGEQLVAVLDLERVVAADDAAAATPA